MHLDANQLVMRSNGCICSKLNAMLLLSPFAVQQILRRSMLLTPCGSRSANRGR